MKFSIKDNFSQCDQIRRKLGIWSHLLIKSLMKNFIFCAVMRLETKTFAKPKNQQKEQEVLLQDKQFEQFCLLTATLT